MVKLYSRFFESPVGILKLTGTDKSLLSVSFLEKEDYNTGHQPDILIETERQLKEYFDGNRKEFNLLLEPNGSAFQKQVWECVSQVEYGHTSTYLAISRLTGSEKKTRAVGHANSKNPIPIIIPCHRIIGTNNKLTGYAGGIERKRWLLGHEQKNSAPKINMLF